MKNIWTLMRMYHHFILFNPQPEHLDIIANSLLRLLRKERSIILSLTSLGLTPSQAIELLSHPTVSAAQNDKGVMDALFDASDRPEEGGVIVWWNDIEKDIK
jgi:UDP-glucose:glycoprotein glucosyltransferase